MTRKTPLFPGLLTITVWLLVLCACAYVLAVFQAHPFPDVWAMIGRMVSGDWN